MSTKRAREARSPSKHETVATQRRPPTSKPACPNWLSVTVCVADVGLCEGLSCKSVSAGAAGVVKKRAG